MTSRIGTLLLALGLGLGQGMIGAPALADEVEDALESALAAYRSGDLAVAKDEVDYVATLLAQQKAASLSAFLPAPLEGWTRDDAGSGAAAAAGVFGGGMMASAEYSIGAERVAIQLMAGNQMVSAMGAMLGNPAMMSSLGTVRRIGRQMVVVTDGGELQAMIDNRVMVQISGSAAVESKIAYFEAMDIAGLKNF